MLITSFSTSEPPARGGLPLVRPLLAARPHWGFGPAAALLHLAHWQRVALPVLAARPATAEELTRDLAGWSLPQPQPLGGASTSWLW